MTLKFSFRVPRWLLWIVPSDLLGRARRFGRAGRSWRHGEVMSGSVVVTADER